MQQTALEDIWSGAGWCIPSTEECFIDEMSVGNIATFKLLEQGAIIVRNMTHFQFVASALAL